MKKKWYLYYLFFCFFLLGTIPTHAESEHIMQSIKVTHNTQNIILIYKKNVLIPDVYLISPNGIRHSLMKENKGLQATDHYEVMSYKHPVRGNWILSGPKQQVAELLVLTQVNLQTNITNDTYYINEMLHLSGSLQQEGQILDTDKVLDNLTMNFELSNLNNKYTYAIPYDSKGTFTNSFILNVDSGTYKGIWRAENTFLSKKRQVDITVEDMPLEQNINAKHNALMIKLIKPDLFLAGTLRIKVLYKGIPQKITSIRTGYAWIMDCSELCTIPEFSKENVVLEITVQTVKKRPVLFKLLLDDKLCAPQAKPMMQDQVEYKNLGERSNLSSD